MAAFDEPTGTREELRALLRSYNEDPADRKRILAQIDRRFVRRVCLLVVDMCGFSRTVKARGIIHFLALLERLERVVHPSIEEAGGRVLRWEADNVFAVFPDVSSALAGVRAIQRDVRAANEALPTDDEVGVSMGVGFGDLLLVGDDDAWGDEMNVASKLGEDLAECGEVLLSESAYGALAERPDALNERTYRVSGVDIRAYALPGVTE
jgi:class 3 adenylate cyclase